MAREINLVPDIKGEMIKALKLRNFIFFLSIVVVAVSIGVTALAGLIMGSQQLAVTNKQNTISALSDKLNSYGDLSDFLTIKDQLGNIATLTSNKKILSRTFSVLSTLIPTGADTITISELSVNLADTYPTFTFDAQANAGKEPFIDYNVLDAFKKSMQFMRYDYGNYVDKNGNTIPAYCMIEYADNGSMLNDPSRGLYAYWTIHAEGCNPSQQSSSSSDSSSTDASSTDTQAATGYEEEDYAGMKVVRIWRTPQFRDWYKEKPVNGQPSMTLDGTISNVPHFASSCLTYQGDASNNSAEPQWTETNNECKLVPNTDIESTEGAGIRITDSSNGRGENEELVLRFSAVIAIEPAVFNFNNHHMMAIPPSGRHNVTDSYIQIQAMFGERAKDCAAGDSTCSTAPTNDDNSNSNNTNNNSNNSNNNSNNSNTNNNSSNNNQNTNGGQQNG